MSIAVYPGTFDPVTKGHLDLITRSISVFDKVVVGVAESAGKNPLFTTDERVNLVKESVAGMSGVEVYHFGNLLTEFCDSIKADVIIRGLRAVSDFEYELQLSQMNRKLNSKVESVFMMPSVEFTFISSKIIKEVASYGGDITEMVPSPVVKALRDKFGQ